MMAFKEHTNGLMNIEGVMTTKMGALYGIGVGPGDPDLITLKSIKVLGQVEVVFAAASTKNNYSLAVNIAQPHIPPKTPIQLLAFPMSRDQKVKQAAWEAHARTIYKEMQAGRDVAFLTLGDPLTYSTFGYILKHLQLLEPNVPIVTIPGITSYQASAACLNTPLVEGEEALLIVSGVYGGQRLRCFAEKPENIVFLKAYKNVNDIVDTLEDLDFLENSVGISCCGLPGQKVTRDVRELAHCPPDYWTLVIAKQKKERNH